MDLMFNPDVFHKLTCSKKSSFNSIFDTVRILHTNIDQFLNKVDDLKMVIAGNEPDLILITEILPKSHCNSLSAARLSLPSYQSFFNFDPDSPQLIQHQCGVGIYVSDKFSVSEVPFSESLFYEHKWIKIKLRGNDSLLVSCIYRNPTSDFQ